jgi:aryl-alcohol dehydrogenase-like predicted oxidoreductase
VNLQSGYSLLDRTAAADAFDVCARLGIGFTAYSPLAGGWLSGKYRSGEAFPAGSRMTLRPQPYEGWLNPATVAGIATLGWAAAERGIPLTQLALAWVLTDPGVCAAIAGPRRPQHLADAVAALDVILTQQEREAIAALVPGS